MSVGDSSPVWDGLSALGGEFFSRSSLERFRSRSTEYLGSWAQNLSAFLEGEADPLPQAGWRLGYCKGRRLCWEEFENQDAAELRYSELWWSRAILDPRGQVVKCCTAPLDPKGAGVARLILAAKGNSDMACPIQAIDSGEAPFIPPDRLPGIPQALQLVWDKIGSRTAVSWFGVDALCYFDIATYPNVQGHVALTIDDVPCRLGPQNSYIPAVKALLREHNAHATFMLMGKFIPGNEADLVSLLADGHEFGNHGLIDKSYANDSWDDFSSAVDECSEKIRALQRQAGVPEQVQWFRAPHGKLSSDMTKVLKQRNLQNVMCDTFACCPVIQDGDFIGRFLARQAEQGSIILIHMPEKGFREWCFAGLQRLLLQLTERGLKTTSVGNLAQLAGYRQSHL
mmetsp:Transcript_48408/g.90705  ORF Transcript_48408/g.90705 Transcript_48408/m.90705 type:complete len:398 (-) Transcript_48408:166-1359(-)